MSQEELEESLKTFKSYTKFLKIITQIMKADRDTRFDTGIYKHYNAEYRGYCTCCDDSQFDEKLDIIKINRKNKEMDFNDIILLFNKIKKQLKTLKGYRCDAPLYYYQDIDYDYDSNTGIETFSIIWDTRK